MLNELFTERWSLLLAAIEEADRSRSQRRARSSTRSPRFIIDSYRHDPELMKVIIVEVTRAANSFGRTHLAEIRRAYDLIAKIVADAQAAGDVPQRRRRRVRLDVVLRRDRAAALGWVFELIPGADARLRPGQASWSSRRSAAASSRAARLGARRCGSRSPARGARTGSLHGAAKALNLVVGLIALPLWLIGQRLGEPLRRAARRADREPRRAARAAPRERSMDALMADLEAIPDDLAPLRVGDAAQGPARHLDVRPRPAARGRQPRLRLSARSSPTTSSRAPTASGSRRASAFTRRRAPGLIVVHGLFSTRGASTTCARSPCAPSTSGASTSPPSTCAASGSPNLTSQAPTSARLEGGRGPDRRRPLPEGARRDHASARWGSRSAAARCSAPATRKVPSEALDGGILAISPPADPRRWPSGSRASCRARTPPTRSTRASGRCCTSRVRRSRWPEDPGLRGPARAHLGAVLRRRAGGALAAAPRPQDHIAGAKVPVLVLHPEDDDDHPGRARPELAEAAAGNDLVRVWILPGGGHGAIDAVDGAGPTPSTAVSSSAGPGTPRDGRQRRGVALGPPSTKLIYSGAR